ncbi:amino acid adenylation domain-containing protein [Pseudomonas sp. GD03858]|uniref:non-ribosomal peptide synthetase family protein n=1 Tax=unclassified Pseudomonas TaxID=196821 RepID=UPI00244AAEF0|nr:MULTISPECIES: amino acid adenylation domain-containing protein [unclassified Pseudomonas]MDH0646895.1 amino acid adenylation domain-containing protein [Pseudomonas sp. GD03867]MDH0663797.1 amino acid adenylation domain-containing protein [Pseudomonas sp. GD03858]
MDYANAGTVVELFEHQAELQAQKTAIYHGAQSVSYQALNERANRLARHLIDIGVTPGALVAICAVQSFDRPLFMLAVMKAGAAYVPLDPDYPEARLELILEDTGARFLIACEQVLEKFSSYQGQRVVPAEEEQARMIADHPAGNLRVNVAPHDLIYVIYTSGSTGKPKGVAVHHGAVHSFAVNYPRVTGVCAKNKVIQLLSYTFDASFMDLWIPLLVGASLYLYPDNKVLGAPLLDFIRANHIDVITMITPTILASLPTEEPIGELRSIGVGGEACAEHVFLYWADKVKLYNAYGPTESTIAVTCHPYQPGQSVRTIGKPLTGVGFHVLDATLQPLPVGEPGELFISGDQLAKEYLGKPEQTRERFVFIDADVGSPRLRAYRTGDIVRRLADDNLEFIGRNDTQLKVRGFRIEAAEIEGAINVLEDVKEAAVVAVNAEHGQPILAAFVTLGGATRETALQVKARIRKALHKTLPTYMVPDKIVILDSLPLAFSGKVDRKALQAMPTDEALSLDGYDEQDIEGILAAIWRHVLQVQDIDPRDNFFELGGHSLGVVRVLTALPAQIRKHLTLIDLYLYPTLEGLAAQVRARHDQVPLTFEEKQRISTQVLLGDISLQADHDYPTQIDPDVLANPRKVLLTGATGFVGAHLLLELLNTTTAEVYCLVRAESVIHAISRIKFTLEKYKQAWPEEHAARIKPVVGDFTLARMGLPEAAYRDLASEVEVVYHTGGNVNYIKPYPIMKAVNVDGIQQIIEFATRFKLKYLVACSTVAVFSWGYLLTGKTWMYEDEDIHQNLPVVCRDTNYVRSKWVMERVLEQASQKGLPVIGIRLGFVMCNGETGATEMNQWWGSFVRCCLSLGTYPMIMGLKDQLVTVDFVAKAIVHIARNKDAVGQYFHMVPDPVNDLSVSDFFVRLNEIFDLDLKPAHFHDWLALWRNNENSPLYSLLSLFTEEVVPGKSLVEVYEMTYYFERRNTDRFLAGSGIRTPPLDKALLSRYLDFMGVTQHRNK